MAAVMFELEGRLPTHPEVGPAETGRFDGLPTTECPTGSLTFVRSKKGAYTSERNLKLRNSLLASVGFLEVANAGDFAANVFNANPVPVYAMVIMALGGVVAFTMIYFAAMDCRLALRNLRGLREERRYLQSERRRHAQGQHGAMLLTIDCLLNINFRESGMEVIDRLVMDTLLGTGAFFVGIGTFMAIDGQNSRIYRASNLLTGYMGNAPCALYGLMNFLWSTVYVWRRATRHKAAALPHVRDRRFRDLLQMRASSVQFHGALNGASGIVAGASAMITATLWWGYVVLAPCLVTSALINGFWRKRVGYDRSFVRDLVPMDDETILEALAVVDDSHRRFLLHSEKDDPLPALVSNPKSLSSVIEFITENQLFEEFCLRVLREADLSDKLFGAADRVTISWRDITAITDEAVASRLIRMASQMIRDRAPTCFRHQERFLLEALGCHMYMTAETTKRGHVSGAAAEARRDDPRYRGARTEIGRHTNDWIFGGFSVSRLVRSAFVT